MVYRIIIKLVLSVVLILACPVGFAALSFDTSAQAAVSNANPITLAFTCGANAKLLVVFLSVNVNSGRTFGILTYDGDSMIPVLPDDVNAGAEVSSEMWYLPNPTTGSAVNISVPNAGTDNIRVMAASFNTSAPSAGLESYSTSNTNAANPSISITPSTDGTAIVGVLAGGNNTVPSADSQTTIFSQDEGTWSSNSQYAVQATKAAITLSWTVNSDDVAMIVAVFKEAWGTLLRGTSLVTGTSKINGH